MWLLYQHLPRGYQLKSVWHGHLPLWFFIGLIEGEYQKVVQSWLRTVQLKERASSYKVRYDFLAYWFYFICVLYEEFRSADMFSLRALFAP